MAKIEEFALMWPGLPGRLQQDRYSLARAFIAKMVLNLPTTSSLLERLHANATLRRLCCWQILSTEGQSHLSWACYRSIFGNKSKNPQ